MSSFCFFVFDVKKGYNAEGFGGAATPNIRFSTILVKSLTQALRHNENLCSKNTIDLYVLMCALMMGEGGGVVL
jgi:hypothetical protein